MIDHVWSVLCRRSSIDRETNNISLFDVVEQLQLFEGSEVPSSVAGPFEIVSLWTRSAEPTRGEAQISLRGPSGRLLIPPLLQEIDLREARRLRARQRLSLIPIEGSGVHVFSIERRLHGRERWDEVATIPVDVVLRAGPPSRRTPEGEFPRSSHGR